MTTSLVTHGMICNKILYVAVHDTPTVIAVDDVSPTVTATVPPPEEPPEGVPDVIFVDDVSPTITSTTGVSAPAPIKDPEVIATDPVVPTIRAAVVEE